MRLQGGEGGGEEGDVVHAYAHLWGGVGRCGDHVGRCGDRVGRCGDHL